MRSAETLNRTAPRARASAAAPEMPRQRRDEILLEAAAQLTPVVLTARTAECWQVYKSRLLSAEPGQRLLVERSDNTPGGPPEIAPGEELGVTFRRGHRKCMFSARVQPPASVVLGDRRHTALVLSWPDWMQEFQRRVYQRVAPPPDQSIEVHVWRGGAEQRPASSAAAGSGVHVGAVCDLSVGGMAMTLAGVHPLRAGDALGCAFSARPNDEPFVLDATLRHVGRDAEGRSVLGLQFVGLETSGYGREAVTRLAKTVTGFHRLQSRRNEARWRRAPKPV
ncbi:MAG TPA: PilZ domain-containing protein [Phycisphaerae bacterium]